MNPERTQPERTQREWDAINAAEEASLSVQTRNKVEQLRPANTNKAYYPKQDQFTKWCKAAKYTNDFVTEMKVIRFLEYIRQRGIITERKNEDGSISQVRKAYGYETLKMYIKACVDLHNQQKAENKANGITFTHPRGFDLKNYESNLKKECTKNKASQYDDPGVNSIQDGYTTEELVTLANYYLAKQKNVCSALRDRMVFLLNHMMMLRGESLRDCQFNHIFTLDFKDEGPQRCPAFVMMILAGKTNQENSTLYSGVIRNKNVFTCAFGAIGFYLFYRFHIWGEAFPDFTLNENWFDTKLARGQDKNKAVSYGQQLASINKAFAFAGINSSKKTHSGRQSGARDAETSGLSHDHIRRVGRWNNDSLQKSYLDNLPRTAIRVMAGFSDTKGLFWLERNLVTSPTSLQTMIFPKVEEWQQKMKNDSKIQTICGQGFLSLLVELRSIILQDAVAIRQIYPEHSIFEYPIFQTPEFNAFSEQLLTAMATTKPPAELEAQRVLPFLNERIDMITHQVNAINNINGDNNAALAEVVVSLKRSVDVLTDKVDALAAGGLVVSGDSERRVIRRVVNDNEEAEVEGAVTVSDNVEQQEKSYKLSRDNMTVYSLWKEWTVGLTDSLPSVKHLDEKYGTKWRSETKERKYYSTRLVIIKEIQRISEEDSISLEDAVQKLEDRRREVPGGCSLDKLSRILKNRT